MEVVTLYWWNLGHLIPRNTAGIPECDYLVVIGYLSYLRQWKQPLTVTCCWGKEEPYITEAVSCSGEVEGHGYRGRYW